MEGLLMKRFLMLLILVIAVAMPFVSGCSAKREVTMTMTPEAGKALVAGTREPIDHFNLVLGNIHVYPEDGGTTGAIVLANSATVDLKAVYSGSDTPVLTSELPEGTYYDLTLTFSAVDVDGSFGGLTYQFNHQLNNGNGITVKYDNTKLVVDEDGAELVWEYNAALLLVVDGSTTVVAEGSITIK
jgi:hypothetical protein